MHNMLATTSKVLHCNPRCIPPALATSVLVDMTYLKSSSGFTLALCGVTEPKTTTLSTVPGATQPACRGVSQARRICM